MIILKRYENFLNRVDELGFMTLSNILPGFPSVSEETPEENWHTGDPDTDPWRWKDRAAEEKRLAFGCIIGGHKGFVSARMYSIFYTAFHPQEHMEERREAGQVSQTVWQLWQLFEGRTLLNTSDIRKELGVTLKKGGSKVDRAIKELQQHYYITVAGSRRKTDKYGQPYGWAANVYDKTENWAPEEWMKLNPGLSSDEARELILANGLAVGKNLNRTDIEKVLCI
ncbi:MAG: hypothetical protein APF77_21820 [Clostridia bacterium BRH_c25]|nr:MAG: hypothetical protein APF77_21820 [Clostridia bacterium BRH_c25]